MWHDLRFCLRSLSRNPGFATVAILTIALGVGANTAMFSLVNSVLLRPLPVGDPGQLVALEEPPGGQNASLSYLAYRDLQQRAEAFRGQLLAMSHVTLSAFSGSNATAVGGELVTGNYYDVLRVTPALGRFFAPDDDRPGAEAVVVVSWAYWQRELGGSAEAVGRQIVLNGRKATVIGVEPEGFFGARLGMAVDVRLPINQAATFRPGTRLENRNQRWLIAMGRIQPGMSLAAARASADVTFDQIVEEEIRALPPDASPSRIQDRREQRVFLQPAPGGFRNTQRNLGKPLWLLLAVTGLVLLIACANLAGLLIVRGEFRRREIAMRSALGASTSRLVRHLLAEGLAIAMLGGVAGLFLSLWITPAVAAMIPARALAASLVTPDSRVLLYSLATATLTGLLFALTPALRTARGVRGEFLRAGASTEGGGGMLRLRGVLLAGQVALSMVLLIGAGLFIRTLLNLRGQETGFERQNVLTATLAPYLNGYKTPASLALLQDLLARVRSLPGVRDAGYSNESLMAGGWDQNGIVVEGLPARENGRGLASRFDFISPGYIGAVRMPLLAGRDINERDTAASPKVALVNEAFAARFFPGQNPLGRHLGLSEPGAKPDIEIVGVLKNAKYVELREGQAPPYVYVPYTQAPLFEQTLHVAVAGDPLAIVSALRDQLRQIDPQLPLANVHTLENQIEQSMSGERALAWLTSAFGLLATALSAVGLYGVLAYTVTRRTREIGIRVALGAEPADVVRAVLSNTGWLMAAGLVTGAGLSLAAGRFLKSLLYHVETADPLAYASAAAVLIAAAVVASVIPALRASRVDPMEALRSE